jgi:hypothetical protein
MKQVTKIILLLSVLAQIGCGVRGRPQPPLTPAQIGRGQPTFTRDSEDLAFPSVPSPDASPMPRKTLPSGESN